MVASTRSRIFKIRRDSDQWTYWSSSPKSILYFLRDLALFFIFSIQFTVRAFFFIGFYYLVYPQLEPQPKKDDPLYSISPYFLPNQPFKTNLFIFFFRELAAYQHLELRTARFVGDIAAAMSKFKTRFSLGAGFVRRRRKRPVSIEKFEFVVQRKHEVDLAEDYGEVYGDRDDQSAQELLKGKRKLSGDLILTNGLKGNVMLYFHGGGYIYYSPAVHRSYLARLAEIGIDIYSLDYRLAPEHPFPAAIHDAIATYQYLRSDLGIPAERLFIGGDSAGAGLCIALLQILERERIPPPAGAYLMSPGVDLNLADNSLYLNYRHDTIGIALHPTISCAKCYVGLGCSNKEFKKLMESSLLNSAMYSSSLPKSLPPILIQSSPHEVIHDSISLFVRSLRSHLSNSKITFELYDETMHVFPIFGDITSLRKDDVDLVDVSIERIRLWMELVSSGQDKRKLNVDVRFKGSHVEMTKADQSSRAGSLSSITEDTDVF